MPMIQSIVVENNTSRLDYSYLYNQAGMKTLEVEKELIGTQWQNVSQVEWIYDMSQCTTQTFYEYAGNQRERVYEITTEYGEDFPVCVRETDYSGDEALLKTVTCMEYDESGRLSEERVYMNPGGTLGEPSSSKSCVYDAEGMLEKLSITDATGNVLYEITCGYTSDGKPKQQVLRERRNSSLENQSRYIWVYDKENRLVYLLDQSWQETDAGYDWVNVSNVTYDYENDMLLSETYQYWNVECWMDNMRYVYEYDADGLCAGRSLQLPLYDTWRTMSVIYYDNSLYPQKTRIYSEYSFWGGDDGAQNTTWLPFVFSADNMESKVGYSMEITYNQRSVTENVEAGMTGLHVYPNPSNGIYYIDIGKYDIVSWSVYALDGSLVSTCVNTNRTGVIDISAQQPGVYMLRAENNSGTYITKLIKQ